MRRTPPRYCNDQGLEESVSVILMVILVIAVAAIIASIVFGLVILFPKSAYIAVHTDAKNASLDNWYLTVFHMNGDAAYLNHTLSTNDGMPVDFQFTTPGGLTVIPLPDPADGPATWKPGDTLYVFNNSGLLEVTKNEAFAKSGTGLPQGVWRFDVVDKTDGVLVYTTHLGIGVSTPSSTYTITASTAINGTISPAGVTTVNSGGSQSYSIIPNSGYHVLDVLVDGSSVGNVTMYLFTNVQASHTISATFAITTYTITATSGSNGAVTPAGITTVNAGGSQVYTVTPDPGYHFDTLTVDGNSASLTGLNTYTFTNVQASHTISATFAINTYTITATTGANGAVTPAGPVTYSYGATPTYNIVPITGYHVADVLVNTRSLGAVTSYTFPAVSSDQKISATFAQNAALSITLLNPSSATAGGAGFTLTVTGTGYISGSVVNWNGVARATNYISATQLNTTIQPSDIASAGTASVTVVNPGPVTSNTATFTINPNTFTIKATSGANGAVNPSGITTLNSGDNYLYTITPNPGYHIADVLVDSSSVGIVTTYQFTNVQASHTISATFAINTYTITSSVTSGTGTISPLGSTNVPYGGSQTYTITPGAGNYVASVLVDGSPAGSPTGSATTYTFSSVSATHTIKVTFTPNPVITSSVTSGTGTISPLGSKSVPYGGSQTYTITPGAGYAIADLNVDGGSEGPLASYTFTNVVTSHTISAKFVVNPPIPAVTGVSPDTGPTTGGTPVTITGTGFTGSTAVWFGSTAATSFTVISDTQILAYSPVENTGTVDVYVTTPGGTSGKTPSDHFLYKKP